MTDINSILGDEAESLLTHQCSGISADSLHLPGPDYIERVVMQKNRSPAVLRNLACIFKQGRLAGSGYLSLLPVDQGVERLISTRKTSSSWRSRVAVMPWPRPSACSVRYRAAMRTGSRL